MAIKKPIALYGGKLKELQSGDTISVGINNIFQKQIEIDFGSTPIYEQIFTITDIDVIPSSTIIANMAYRAPTGKEIDECEMDELDIKCGPTISGQFSMLIRSKDGSYLHDKFFINYIIST